MFNTCFRPTFCLVATLSLGLSLGCGNDDDDPVVDAAVGGTIDSAVSIDATGNAPDAANQSDGGSFGIVSSAYLEGGVIPIVHSCHGDNISPALMWGNAPVGTQSFAIVFLDTSTNFLHSVIWDIPGNLAELPEGIDNAFEPTDVPGAKQALSYNNLRGYDGPCPRVTHTYEHRLYAIDMAKLPGGSANSSGSQMVAAIQAAAISSVALTGSYTPPN